MQTVNKQDYILTPLYLNSIYMQKLVRHLNELNLYKYYVAQIDYGALNYVIPHTK